MSPVLTHFVCVRGQNLLTYMLGTTARSACRRRVLVAPLSTRGMFQLPLASRASSSCPCLALLLPAPRALPRLSQLGVVRRLHRVRASWLVCVRVSLELVVAPTEFLLRQGLLRVHTVHFVRPRILVSRAGFTVHFVRLLLPVRRARLRPCAACPFGGSLQWTLPLITIWRIILEVFT